MLDAIYNWFRGTKTYDNCGAGVVTISGATPHSTDQIPFFIWANTDASVNIVAIDGSTHSSVTILAGTSFPAMCKQVTAINSGTIMGIR